MRDRTRPTLVELDKEERIRERSPIDNGFHQVDKSHDHEADEEEWDERPQVVPSYHEAIAQAAEPTLPPGMRGVTR